MGLIRKTLRVATLPAGPLGVKGSSKKQRVAKAALKELQAANRPAEHPLKADMLNAMRERHTHRIAAIKSKRKQPEVSAEHRAMEELWKQEVKDLKARIKSEPF